jgi:hypothetical protein
MATIVPSKFRTCEETVESPGMALRGVYSWGGMLTIPILGIDGLHGAFLNSCVFCCFNLSFAFLLASTSSASHLASTSSTILLAYASSASLLDFASLSSLLSYYSYFFFWRVFYSILISFSLFIISSSDRIFWYSFLDCSLFCSNFFAFLIFSCSLLFNFSFSSCSSL